MRLTDFTFASPENNQPIGRALLVGMLEDGPTARGFTLTNPNNATTLLGDNDVTRAYNYLIEHGLHPNDILLYRLNGSQGYTFLEDLNGNNVLELRSITGHDEENNIYVQTSEEGLSIRSNYSDEFLEIGRRRNFTRTYRYDDYPYTQELADAIMDDAILGIHNIVAQAVVQGESSMLHPNREFPLHHADADEGVCVLHGRFPDDHAEQYWERFVPSMLGENYQGESNQHIMTHQCEVMYFPDFPIDESKHIGMLASDIAMQKTDEQDILCTALFRTSPVPATKTLREEEYMVGTDMYYDSMTGEIEPWMPTYERDSFVHRLSSLFSEEEKEQLRLRHMQVVVGEEYLGLDEEEEEMFLPGATFYLLHFLGQTRYRPLTNLRLLDFGALHSELSKPLVASLASNGYICIVPSVRKHMANTKAQYLFKDSERDKEDFYVFRLLSYLKRDLVRILDKYIGDSNQVYQMAHIEDELNDYLEQYESLNVLSGYTLHEIEEPTPSGNAQIHLDLSVYGQIGSVNVNISSQDEGWGLDLWEIANG